MKRYLQLEYYKYRYSRTFWVINLVFVVLLVLGALVVYGTTQKHGLAFPMVWVNFTYAASFFDILPGLLLISSISVEYQYKTLRQHIVDGLSKNEFLISKYLFLLLIALGCSVLVFLINIIAGLICTPTGQQYQLFNGAVQVFYYFLQLVGYMSLAATFAFLFRNSAIASVIYIVYVWMFEWLLAIILRNSDSLSGIGAYLPKTIFGKLVQEPALIQTIMQAEKMGAAFLPQSTVVTASIIWCIFFGVLNYLLLNKRDA
jgi:ABC-type transport system involved in multi-copper enzyme maturation permease subunit